MFGHIQFWYLLFFYFFQVQCMGDPSTVPNRSTGVHRWAVMQHLPKKYILTDKSNTRYELYPVCIYLAILDGFETKNPAYTI